MNTIIETDENGRIIYYKDGRRDEYWQKYDEYGNLVYRRTYCSHWERTYDSAGRCIYYRNIKRGSWYEKEYDEAGNCIHHKSNGTEWWQKYDERGNVIYRKTKTSEKWFEYDERGNMIHWKDDKGREIINRYNDKGVRIYHKHYNGTEWKIDL